jgi:hypothetical protein
MGNITGRKSWSIQHVDSHELCHRKAVKTKPRAGSHVQSQRQSWIISQVFNHVQYHRKAVIDKTTGSQSRAIP